MHYSCGPVDRQAQQAATFHHLKGKQFPETVLICIHLKQL